jgi:DNA-binding transcriptional LysR family regulator
MDLRHIKAFKAVMQTGSTVEAARLLGVSQPSVSRLLAEFETATGEVLFTRANGRLTPRDTAALLLPDVDRTLAGFDGLTRRADRSALPLRIAAPAGVIARLIAPAVQRLLDDRPGQKIVAEIMTYHDVVSAVAAGRVDVGFVKSPVDHPALAIRPLVKVGTDVVLPGDHGLARKDRITPRDLAAEDLILLGRNRPFRAELDQIFARAGLRMEVFIETQAVSAACAFVRQGLGVTIANSLLARAEAAPDLTCRPFAGAPQHAFALAWQKEPNRPRMLTAFADHVAAVAAELLDSPVIP